MAFDRNEAADVAFGHRPVLLDECMEGLAIRPGGIYLDGTLGRAGHSWEIVRRLNTGGRLIGLDRAELMPLFCELDEVMITLQHGKLHREQTIAKGGEYCDYFITGNKESL